MTDIEKWGPTDDGNNVTPPAGAQDGWFGGQVNEWGREVQASVRRAWQLDEWRDLVPTPGSPRLPTRTSDTQVTFPGENLTAIFVPGRRVRITNTLAASKIGVVLTSSFVVDTLVTFVLDPEDDGKGETQLGSGSTVITASSDNIADNGAGSDPTPYSEFETGDILRIASGANTGFYSVVKNSGVSLDLTPLGDYVLSDEGDTIEQYWLDKGGILPATDVLSVEIAGAHTDVNPYPVIGALATDISGALAATAFGDAAFQRAADMEVADAQTLNSVAEADLDVANADTLDGLHASEVGARFEWQLTSDFTLPNNTVENLVTGLSNLTLPGVPDGATRYRMRVHLVFTKSGAGGNHTARVRGGDQGDITDDVLLDDVESTGFGSNTQIVGAHNFVWTPAAGDDKISVSMQHSVQPTENLAKGTAYDWDNGDSELTACYLIIETLGN